MSPIMKAKEKRIARGASPFIIKAGASSIPSPITKERASPFIMKADTFPIPNIERCALQRNVSISYASYNACEELKKGLVLSSSPPPYYFLPL
jgi:hypothetical protein